MSAKTLLEDLKIKTDIDLRLESIVGTNSTPLGKDVKYIRLPCKSYGDFFMKNTQ